MVENFVPDRYFEVMKKGRLLTLGSFLFAGNAAFAAEGSGHNDPISTALLVLIAILVAAKLGGELFERLGLPSVLGELIGGIVLGNLVLVNPGWALFEPLRIDSRSGILADCHRQPCPPRRHHSAFRGRA